MEEDYVVKYTVLGNYPLGLSPCLNNNESVRGYVVSPCYIVSENEVVLPFDYRSGKLVKPLYDEKGKCSNSVFVEALFDTLNDAKKYAQSLTSILKARCNIFAYQNYYKESYVLYHSKLEELLTNHKIYTSECDEIQRNIMYICKDLIIEEGKEEKKSAVRSKRFSFRKVNSSDE